MVENSYLYRLTLLPPFDKEANWTDEAVQLRNNHFEYLVKLKDKGKIILVGRTDVALDHPGNTGICIFKADDIDEAKQIAANDPAVMGNLMKAEVLPFKVVLKESN